MGQSLSASKHGYLPDDEVSLCIKSALPSHVSPLPGSRTRPQGPSPCRGVLGATPRTNASQLHIRRRVASDGLRGKQSTSFFLHCPEARDLKDAVMIFREIVGQGFSTRRRGGSRDAAPAAWMIRLRNTIKGTKPRRPQYMKSVYLWRSIGTETAYEWWTSSGGMPLRKLGIS